MSGWQPQQYDPGQHQRRISQTPPQEEQSAPYGQMPPGYRQPPQYQPPEMHVHASDAIVRPHVQTRNAPQFPPQRAARKTGLTAAGAFWYILGCIPMAAMYFCKVPAKKALQDFGMGRMTAAEQFWYVLMCIPLGAGYFCKLPISKALAETQPQAPGYR